MSGRSPSGVASLRARFEHKGESTSPPSRDRSPAGSTTSDSSRPISKVRTSFVSVEGSGKMSDQLGVKEPMENEVVNGDGVDGSKATVNGDIVDKPQLNGGSPQSSQAEPSATSVEATEKAETKATGATNGATDGPSDANPDKPVSTVEVSTPKMLPSDPKDEEAVSGGAALGQDTAGLGSILKGSPFEPHKSKTGSPSQSPNVQAAGVPSQSPKRQTKSPSVPNTNGRSKETQSKPKNASVNTSAAPKAASQPGSSEAPKTPTSKPKDATHPTTIESQPSTSPAASNGNATSKSKIQKTPAPPGPRAPTNAASSGKQSSPKKASPKSAPSKDSKKEPGKYVKKPANRTSAVSKPATAVSSKASGSAPTSGASTGKPVKKPDTTSPNQPFTKPRPKSPTRPVRLPAAATAPTAASAAKVDGSPPSENPRQPKTTGAHNLHGVSKVSQNPPKSQSKPIRTSLPSGSKAIEKSKAPKPRTSMASSKAPEGGFLERMMRPTQSSSQKTHDKAPNPPQAKHQGTKPKRMSEDSDKSKAEHEETKAEPPKELTSAGQGPAETSETPSINGASASVTAAAHTVPATNPAP